MYHVLSVDVGQTKKDLTEDPPHRLRVAFEASLIDQGAEGASTTEFHLDVEDTAGNIRLGQGGHRQESGCRLALDLRQGRRRLQFLLFRLLAESRGTSFETDLLIRPLVNSLQGETYEVVAVSPVEECLHFVAVLFVRSRLSRCPAPVRL